MCSRRKCDGMSALGLAVEKGYIDVLRELLAAGTNPDGVNDDGLTALHIAAQDGQVEAIDVLIAAGADAESRDDDDDTPLHAACSSLQPDSVRYALDMFTVLCCTTFLFFVFFFVRLIPHTHEAV